MAEPRFLLSGQIRRESGRVCRPFDTWAGEPIPTLWRLVGANNREIGRAAQQFSDARTCRHGITLLRRQVDNLVPTMWCNQAGMWLWRLELDKRPIAQAARAYLRRRESVFNLDQFLAAVPVAAVPGLGPEPRAPHDPLTPVVVPTRVGTTDEVLGAAG